MASIITAHDLNLWYGDFKALKGISLDVGEQEITALIGPSGCGISTTSPSLLRNATFPIEERLGHFVKLYLFARGSPR